MSESKLYSITGIWCGSCAKSVEAKVMSHFNVKSSVDLATQTLQFSGAKTPTLESLSKALGPSGYIVSDFQDVDAKLEGNKLFEKKLLKRLACVVFSSIWVMSLSISGYLEIMGPLSNESLWRMNWIMVLLSLPGIMYGGSFIYLMAWQNLKIKKLTIDSLITLSVFTCGVLSVLNLINGAGDLYLDSALMVLLVFSSIKFLEHKVFQAQATSIYSLDEERLKHSTVLKDGKKISKKNVQIKAGQTVYTKNGDFIFFDGKVQEGRAVVNVSSSNGEEDPRMVGPGDRLSYGSIIIKGELAIKIDEGFGERQVDKSFRDSVIKFHENKIASGSRLIDAAIELAVPALLLLSSCYFFIEHFYLGYELTPALVKALSLILVFCPCVLYLSRPLVLLALVNSLKSRGVLLRNPTALSNLKNIKSIVFDKTGTLTGDNHEIQLVNNRSGLSTDKLWRIVGGMEAKFTHPIATAVARALWAFQLEPVKLEAKFLPSKGFQASFEGHDFFFGKPLDSKFTNQLELLRDGKSIATFRLTIKNAENRQDLLNYLKSKAIKKFLLTGDSLENTDHFTKEQNLEFDKVYANKSVKAKGATVQEIQEQFGESIYVGDGENDIDAFAKSTVSMSLSNSSQNIKSASDITLPTISLKTMKTLFDASEQYDKRIIQNFVLAGLYNAIAIYFSLGGYLKPSYAILAMSMSTLLLLFNSIRASFTF